MITIVLEDENAKILSEQVCISTKLISQIGDNRFACLRFVDPYGDTIFNRYQMSDLLNDLNKLKKDPQNKEYEDKIKQIENLVENCTVEPHTYIRFIGD